MPGASIRLRNVGPSERGRRTLAEGLLLTLTDPSASDAARVRARESAKALGITESEPTKVVRAVARLIQEAPIDAAPPAAAKAPPAAKPSKAKGRGGKPEAKPPKPGQPKSGEFEGKHPRGRGGLWIKKGAGMGQSGPQQNVSQLQTRLAQLGYGPGAADGRFGNLTEDAVRRFQADYGLQQTGQVDPATLQTLQTPPAQKLADVQAQNRAAAALPNAQGVLPKAKAAAGTTSATAAQAGGAGSTAATTGGNGTTLDTSDPNAVKAFQQAHGLTVDGVAGPNTQAMMKGIGVAPAGSQQTTHNADGTVAAAGGGTAASGTGTGTKKAAHGTPTNLSVGMGVTGDPVKAVREAQKALNAAGYDLGPEDGRFGPATEAAVKKLQKHYGLKVDGIVGSDTEGLLRRIAKRQKRQAGKGASADQSKLLAARMERSAAEDAGDVDTYVAARARELALSEAADRALVASYPLMHTDDEKGTPMRGHGIEEFLGRGGQTVDFNPSLHPRDRRGKFRAALNSLSVGDKVKLPTGITVKRTSEGFDVRAPGLPKDRTPNVDRATAAALDHHDAFAPSPVDAMRKALKDVGPQRSITDQFPADKRYRKRHGLMKGDPGVVHHYGKLHEAIELREAATTPEEFTAARAREVAVAGMLMEGKALSAEARKSSATVVRKKGGTTEYKFPIPDKGHAHAALAYLNSSDLTGDEKARVRAKAKAVLKEAEFLDELDEADYELVEALIEEAADSLVKASTPEPFSRSKTSNWVARNGGLPAYIQHIAHDLVEKRGKSESNAIQMAIGIVKRWARGGGNVDAKTRAAAAKAVAEWEALKGRNAAKKAA